MNTSRKSLILGVLAGLSFGLLSAQNASVPHNGPLTTISDALRSHGIELSRSALIAALRNDNPEVRSLAALKLSEDHDSGAIPWIEEALAVERVPTTEIGIAQALWSLKDSNGLEHLQKMCSDPSLSIEVIVRLVQSLGVINESSAPCAGFVLGYLESHADSESRSIALLALQPMYKWVPENQAKRIAEMLEEMLSDRGPYVRLQAGDALVDAGLRSSVPSLRDALSRESDPVMRSALQSDIDRLEKQP